MVHITQQTPIVVRRAENSEDAEAAAVRAEAAAAAAEAAAASIEDPVDLDQLDERTRDTIGTALVGSAGITVTPNDVGNTIGFTLDPTLVALSAYNTNGLLVQTAADTFVGRTLTAGSAKLAVTNGDGVAGNPTVDLGSVASTDLTDGAALAATIAGKQSSDGMLTSLSGAHSDGILVQTAANTATTRVLGAGSAKLTVTNGDGVAGNPTFDLGVVNSTDLADTATLVRAGKIITNGVTIRANRIAGRIATLPASADVNNIADAATYFASSDHASYAGAPALGSNGAGLRSGVATGTDPSTAHTTDLTPGQYIRIDLGASAPMSAVYLATNSTWGPSLLNGAILSGSTDGTTYTPIATVSGAVDGAYTIVPVGATYRYLRLIGPTGGLAVSEFYVTLDTRGAVQELSVSGRFTLSGSTIDLNYAATSAGAADAGKVVVLDATDGKIDPSLLSGGEDYFRIQRTVSSPEATDGFFDFLGTLQPYLHQAHVYDKGGVATTAWGDRTGGMSIVLVKSRSTGPAQWTAATGPAVVEGDDSLNIQMMAEGSPGTIGHTGGIKHEIDKTPASSTGELAGRWTLTTGTNLHVSEADPARPDRWAQRVAQTWNHWQEIYFPGIYDTPPAPGNRFGGLIRVGRNGPGVGECQVKFTLTDAELMTAPEAGAYEVDEDGNHWVTNAAAARKRLLTDNDRVGPYGAPTVTLGANAGTGATISDTYDGNGHGTITIVGGTGSALGPMAVITFASAFATRSSCVMVGGNQNGSVFPKNGWATCAAGSVTLEASALTNGQTYIIHYSYRGS